MNSKHAQVPLKPTGTGHTIGDVCCPYVVDAGDRQIPQQIGVYGVFWLWLAGVWFWRRTLQAHDAHQSLHTFAIDVGPVSFEHVHEHAATKRWMLEMKFIESAHQIQFFCMLSLTATHPLVHDASESEQRTFDATARKLAKFLAIIT